jgi:hypothetical protein
MFCIETSIFYFNKNSIHAQNEHIYIMHDQPLVLD